jgi:hypothetical protein
MILFMALPEAKYTARIARPALHSPAPSAGSGCLRGDVLPNRWEEALHFPLRLWSAGTDEDTEVVLVVEHQDVRTHLDIPVCFINPGGSELLKDAATSAAANELGEVSKREGWRITSDVNAEQLVQEGALE